MHLAARVLAVVEADLGLGFSAPPELEVLEVSHGGLSVWGVNKLDREGGCRSRRRGPRGVGHGAHV